LVWIESLKGSPCSLLGLFFWIGNPKFFKLR
jgi:hypothetical protein